MTQLRMPVFFFFGKMYSFGSFSIKFWEKLLRRKVGICCINQAGKILLVDF